MVLPPSKNFGAADPLRFDIAPVARRIATLALSSTKLRRCRQPPTGRIGDNWDKAADPAGQLERPVLLYPTFAVAPCGWRIHSRIWS
jgi:hypothetical protein